MRHVHVTKKVINIRTTKMLRLVCVLLLTAGTLTIFSPASVSVEAAESSQSYPITTLINAKWTQTPLYLEIAEYLADEQAGLFWDYVQAVTTLDTALNDYGRWSMRKQLSVQTKQEKYC